MKRRYQQLLSVGLFLLATTPTVAQRVEYFWDTDPGVCRGQVLGQFTGKTAIVTDSLDVGNLVPGIHILGLRTLNTAKDAKKTGSNGYVSQTGDNKTKTFCSATYARAFFIPAVTEKITRMEYSWDSNVAPGKGKALQFTANQDGASFASELSVGNLAPGLHTLFVRTLSTGHSSATYSRLFFIPEPKQKITGMEYSWDSDVLPGKGTPLKFVASNDSAWFGPSLSVGNLTPGLHMLYVRTLSTGHHSATYARLFFIPEPKQQLTRMEYSWDKEVAPGKGTPLEYTVSNDTAWFGPSLSVSHLSTGLHTLYLRTMSKGLVSKTYARTFYVPAKSHEVEAVEYWFDKDPGLGRATRIAASLTADEDTLKKAFDVNTRQLSDGIHLIGLRTLTDGTWSETKVRRFLVRSVVENQVTRLEYFWNDDPGANNGYVVDITPGKEVSIDFEADMTMLGEGPHTLGLRARSGLYNWSPAKLVSGIEFEGWDNLQEYLDSFEDTQDQLASGKYTRQYKNLDWHALYVPFSLNYGDWADHFDVARINAFYQYDDDEDGVVDRQVLEAIIVKGSNGSLKPNHPYLIRAKQKGSYDFAVPASKQVEKAINSISCSTMEAKYTFTGNYSNLTGLKTAQRYRLRGGSLSIPDSDDEVLPPYRWYLTIDDLGNQLQPSASSRLQVRIVGEEEATEMDDSSQFTVHSSQSVYDLQGRKLSDGKLRKGLYIINNKKHLVK